MELHGDLANHPTDPIQLKKGKNKLVVTYQSPSEGDCLVLRLLGAASGKTLEAISPTVFQHDEEDAALTSHRSDRQGRELVATLRCAGCHAGITGSMPELTEDAPSFTDIEPLEHRMGSHRWITQPQGQRPRIHAMRVP